jgi:hypothetical protein
MHVIVSVTTDTRTREAGTPSYRFVVTRCTGESLVAVFKLEVGLRIVVETPVFPALAVVAGTAFCAKGTLVLIFLFVTVVTFSRCVLEALALVAFLTFDFFMFAQKGKAGQAVIEQGVCPGFFGVTAFATLTQLALVLVIGLVTGIALC